MLWCCSRPSITYSDLLRQTCRLIGSSRQIWLYRFSFCWGEARGFDQRRELSTFSREWAWPHAFFSRQIILQQLAFVSLRAVSIGRRRIPGRCAPGGCGAGGWGKSSCPRIAVWCQRTRFRGASNWLCLAAVRTGFSGIRWVGARKKMRKNPIASRPCKRPEKTRPVWPASKIRWKFIPSTRRRSVQLSKEIAADRQK